MGLNEDLGDRENVGSAAVATQRHREARKKDRQEAEKFANWMIEVVNGDHHDKIEFNRDIGCRIRDHIENLRRDTCAIRVKNACEMKVGDRLWWQGNRAMWTPKPDDGREDIVLERIGYSHSNIPPDVLEALM